MKFLLADRERLILTKPIGIVKVAPGCLSHPVPTILPVYEQLFEATLDGEQVFVIQCEPERTGVRKRETP